MKKILFAAVSVVAFFACTKDVITDAPESAIDFASNTQCAVKSTVVDGENFASFQVYAFNGEDVIMDNMEVKKEGTAWTYSPKKYWPATGTVDFFGVYMDELNKITDNYRSECVADPVYGLMFGLDMAITDEVVDAAKIPDAVYATAIGKKKEDGAVHMNFRHAMAQIDFQIRNATNADDKIVVESGDVYVEDLYYSGIYFAPKTQSTTEDTGIGSWDYYGYPKANYIFRSKATSIAADNTSGILSDLCMAFPQAATDVKLVLNCTIKQNGVVIFSGEKTAECNIDWKEGHKYTYIFLLEDKHLKSNVIEFTAGVTAIESGGTQVLPPNN